MNKIPDLNDLIFEKRNKKYGAYGLSKTYGRTILFSAMPINALVFIAFLTLFLHHKANAVKIEERSKLAIQIMMDELIPPVEKQLLPPPDVANPGQPKAINYFRQWVQSRTRYPEEALENQITGRVVLKFVIEKYGSLCQLKVLEGVHPLLDDETIRVVSSRQSGSQVFSEVMLSESGTPCLSFSSLVRQSKWS